VGSNQTHNLFITYKLYHSFTDIKEKNNIYPYYMTESQRKYYEEHKKQRQEYAKAYYLKKKQEKGEEKPKRKYRSWKDNSAQIKQHKEELKEKGVEFVTLTF
jgi:hypothetical protein